jgi:dTDP-4-amino-4,6-dideoxygalactose transaminase
MLGMNSRLDELQAAILRARLAHLLPWTKRRREIATLYATGIDNPRVRALPQPEHPERHVHHLFVVLTAHRVELQTHLRDNQIESLIHYPIPIHEQEPCRALRRDPRGLTSTEAHARACLSLPCHPSMSDADVARVIAAVNVFGA